MLELLQQGFGAVFSIHILMLMAVGVAMGIVFGAVPGLSATMAVALCLPLTFTMGPQAGLSLLVALFIGATSGGLISAILLKIPGTPSSIATVFDGGPLMEKGEGVKALGVGIVFSFLGTIFSIVALMFIAPQLAKVALSFGPHEYFAIAVFSLTLIATLSAGSMVKGLFAGALGIAVSTVGIAPVEAIRRFTFGINELNGGFSMLTVMIGMFAVAEIIKLAESGRHAVQGKARSVSMKNIKGFGFSLKEFREQLPNAARSGAIGLGIGILPGIGAGTSNLVSYIIAKKRAKDGDTYGKGNIGGVVASETANNAGVGGAMMPLMTLGIPGDTVTAIMLGGFLIHGIQPGPLLFISQGPLVYTIFAALIVATCMMLFMEFYGLRLFIKLLDVPKHPPADHPGALRGRCLRPVQPPVRRLVDPAVRPARLRLRQGRHAGGAVHHRLHPRADGGDQPAPGPDAVGRQLRRLLHQPHRRHLPRPGPGIRALAGVQRAAPEAQRDQRDPPHLRRGVEHKRPHTRPLFALPRRQAGRPALS